MEHFLRNAAPIAAPAGPTSFDKCTTRAKARANAKSYLQSRADKHGARFRLNAGWGSLRAHGM